MATLIESGMLRVEEQPFPAWVADDVRAAAEQLTADEAWLQEPACLKKSKST